MKILFCLPLLATLAMISGSAHAVTSASESQVKAAAASNEPSWFRVPEPQGTGAKTITVTSGQSLQDAFNKAQPGDIVEIAQGEYKASKGWPPQLRNAGAMDHRSRRSGATPKIDLNNTGSFQIAASNVVVEGLEIVRGKATTCTSHPGKARSAISSCGG